MPLCDMANDERNTELLQAAGEGGRAKGDAITSDRSDRVPLPEALPEVYARGRICSSQSRPITPARRIGSNKSSPCGRIGRKVISGSDRLTKHSATKIARQKHG